jgi:hypothetical protein
MNWILISWYQVQSCEVESEMLFFAFQGACSGLSFNGFTYVNSKHVCSLGEDVKG